MLRQKKPHKGMLALLAGSSIAAPKISHAANFIYVTTLDGYSTGTNWTQLSNGAHTAPPAGADINFADTLYDSTATVYTAAQATPAHPALLNIPSGTSVNSVSFGNVLNNATAKSVFVANSPFTIGTTGNTLNIAAGVNRQATGTDPLAGGIGGTYPDTQGLDTILSNITLTASQTWAIGGTSGANQGVYIPGTLSEVAGLTVTKSGTAQLEINSDNSITFAGLYVAQGGTTLLDNVNALGNNTLGTASVIQVSGTGAGVKANTNLLTNGLAFNHPITVAANVNHVVATIGGLATQTSDSVWSGNVLLNYPVSLVGGTTTTFSGIISGVGGVNKTDGGTVLLSGINTYGGATNVSGGSLRVNGSNTGGGAVTVAAGGTLGGSGTISTGLAAAGLSLANGGTLTPGSSSGVGSLSVTGDVTLDGTASFTLNALTSTSLLDTGTLTINSDSSLNLVSAATLSAPVYVLATYSALSGTWADANVTGLPTNYTLNYSYLGNEIALVQTSSVPEPGGIVAMATAASAAMMIRRRRRV